MLIINVLINVLILSVNIDVNMIILIYRYNKHEYNLFTLYDFIYEIMYKYFTSTFLSILPLY